MPWSCKHRLDVWCDRTKEVKLWRDGHSSAVNPGKKRPRVQLFLFIITKKVDKPIPDNSNKQ